ncbi:low temperature requirement protein A [Mycobacterium asiaticum]|uniref:Low temperature requirement protein A n=1 Tax=Mycobacterium asiaticum TaxID=1790 RepID=A0A1A3CRW4_MYCAS|nr:low temperature requirement protein A [Mycobacterium asiaticum]OBI88711.1 low temperature requirement protein A [Mycobacterium asiaticum]OBJ89361.1 low temperature requirement protein A [Mycobacterium asiaticum]
MTSEDQESDERAGSTSEGHLELFFDLVFTFAMSQVTQLMLHNLSPSGFGRAALALLAVWWAWVGYTWLINTFDSQGVRHEAIVIAAMAAMLVAAAALPTAFTSGALVFAIALLVVRLIHVAKFVAYSSDEDPGMRRSVRRIAPAFVAAPACIVAAAFVGTPGRELLWIAAAMIDYGAPAVLGLGGFRVSPSYFVSRHGSVIIIALGEAIVELGAGATDLHRFEVITALVLGVAIMATFWWTYFGLTGGAEQRLEQATGMERAHLARDAYSYLHLPLVAGIMLFAVGAHAAVAHATAPLPFLPAVALAGGMMLFYLGDVAYRWRDHHQVPIDRTATGLAAAATLPVLLNLPSVASLGLLTAIGWVRLAWELWRRPRIGPGIAGQAR